MTRKNKPKTTPRLPKTATSEERSPTVRDAVPDWFDGSDSPRAFCLSGREMGSGSGAAVDVSLVAAGSV